ncbi:hypothetical protein FRC05_001053 [Tulasnella sp. 425]|nr:hypothetical protein FRC05_001053 [Tulasnella sp. 425]
MGQASTLSSLAAVHQLRKESSEAIELYSEALQIRTEIGDGPGQASALSSIAQVHQLRKEYNEALVHYSKALQIHTKIGDRPGQASALSSIAQVHQLRTEYSEAIKLYREALEIHTELRDRPGQASALSDIAQVHQLRKEYSEALKLYSEALQIRTEIGDRMGQASTLSSLAEVHQLRKEYSEAIKLYSEALQIRTEIRDRPGQVSALSSIAQVHQLREGYSEALVHFFKRCLNCPAEVHQLRKGFSQALHIRSNLADLKDSAGAVLNHSLTDPLKKPSKTACLHAKYLLVSGNPDLLCTNAATSSTKLCRAAFWLPFPFTAFWELPPTRPSRGVAKRKSDASIGAEDDDDYAPTSKPATKKPRVSKAKAVADPHAQVKQLVQVIITNPNGFAILGPAAMRPQFVLIAQYASTCLQAKLPVPRVLGSPKPCPRTSSKLPQPSWQRRR